MEFTDRLKALNLDRLIIGGDIFDKLPSLEEISVLVNMLRRLNLSKDQILIYDGNHEATKKGHSFFSELKPIINDLATVITERCIIDDMEFLPYSALHSFDGKNKAEILFTHVRGDIPPHVKAEVDLSLFKNYTRVYAGDLHSHNNSQLNIVYPGSPYNTSFNRNNNSKYGVILFNSESYGFVDLSLPQLIKKTVTSKEDAVKTEYDFTVYEVTDASSREVADNPLLDKKIVKKEVRESKMLFTASSMEEELIQYLTEYKGLPEDDVADALALFLGAPE
jgi:DNA repair exonuclease SbcCD nuclease subunit